MKLLDKGLFSDAAARNSLNQGRLCISCAIQKGSYYTRKFYLSGKEVFGCRGCQEAKPQGEKDSSLVEKARWYEVFPETDTGSFIASGVGRWCHGC